MGMIYRDKDMGMNGCTHFKCDGCAKIRLIKEQNVTKVAYTLHNHFTDEKFLYNVHHSQLCNECLKEKESKNEKD
jgi:hypothetical protein